MSSTKIGRILQIVLIFNVCRSSLGEAPAFKDAIAVGTLSPEVFHASGLAASRKHDGVLYTHNDGDDPHRRSPIVFAINASSGALIARLMVYPATNEDWEDIAVGPCGNTSCIYISDKAANVIYRVTEPEFVYSDQILIVDSKVGIEWHHDAPNTLMVDNKGQAYIIASIKGGRGRVGLVKLQDWGHSGVRIDTDVHLNVHGNHHVVNPQSGDVSADGQQVLILMKNQVYFWNVINDDVLQTLSHAPEHVGLPHEGQGSEGVCFDTAGQNYYTVEQKEDANLYFYEREIPLTHSALG